MNIIINIYDDIYEARSRETILLFEKQQFIRRKKQSKFIFIRISSKKIDFLRKVQNHYTLVTSF